MLKKIKKEKKGGEWGGGRGIIFVFTCIASCKAIFFTSVGIISWEFPLFGSLG